jgi:hypothetical protein
MRRSLPFMISASSLSAFSASIVHGGINAGPGVQPARAQAGAARSAPAARPQPPVQAMPPDAMPGEKLPRGSLLDLSV